ALSDVDFGTAAKGMIVGDYGTVMATSDGGSRWAPCPRKTRILLSAVSLRQSQRAAVVGRGFTALTSADGGQTWGGRATITFSNLSGISFTDSQNGMIAGDRGDLFRTADGGVTWQPLNVTGAQNIQWPLEDVAVLDANTAIVVGPNGDPEGWIWRPTDGGLTWTRVLAPTGLSAEGHLRALSFADAQHGMALGLTRVLVTPDGGSSWSEAALPAGSDL